MSAFDRLVEFFSPEAAFRRAQFRKLMASYEGGKRSKQRRLHVDTLSPNELVSGSAVSLRAQARYLERNHDIARGILRTLVNNVVGPNGIGVEFQPRDAGGHVDEAYAKQLNAFWQEWTLCPEVTQMHHWSRVQRLLARTWLRDGEALAQQLIGPVATLSHGTAVPYSLELLEPDMLPLEYDDPASGIRQGIQRNAWGKRSAYWVFKEHPLDTGAFISRSAMKSIPADRMIHVAALDRIGQLRGISEFASVITRLEDIKDYEESERVAAKVAAALTAYVKRGTPDLYREPESGSPENRHIGLSPGTIIDDLAIGEEIGLIDSKRPNPNLLPFRQGQLRAVAAGVGGSYSSTAKDYNGTFSAQRQELVEQWVHYAVLTDDFVGQVVQPVVVGFVMAAHLSGVVPMPKGMTPAQACDVLFIGQAMPWIDPLKEAVAWLTLNRAGYASEVEIIRRRGGRPQDVLDQITKFRNEAAKRDLTFDSDAGKTSKSGTAQDYLRSREGIDTDADLPPGGV